MNWSAEVESPFIAAACVSFVLSRLSLSATVVGGVRGRGTGARGDQEDPEQLRDRGGGEGGRGLLLHHRDQPGWRGQGRALRQDRGSVASSLFHFLSLNVGKRKLQY